MALGESSKFFFQNTSAQEFGEMDQFVFSLCLIRGKIGGKWPFLVSFKAIKCLKMFKYAKNSFYRIINIFMTQENAKLFISIQN